MLKIEKIIVDQKDRSCSAILSNGDQLACSVVEITRTRDVQTVQSFSGESLIIPNPFINTATIQIHGFILESKKTEIDITKAALKGATLYTKQGYSLIDANGLKVTTGIESISLNILDNSKKPDSVTIHLKDNSWIQSYTCLLRPVSKNCYKLSESLDAKTS